MGSVNEIGIKDIKFVVWVGEIEHAFDTLIDAVNFARSERAKGKLDIDLYSTSTYYGW